MWKKSDLRKSQAKHVIFQKVQEKVEEKLLRNLRKTYKNNRVLVDIGRHKTCLHSSFGVFHFCVILCENKY